MSAFSQSSIFHCSPSQAVTSTLNTVEMLETLHEELPPYSAVAENEWEKASPSLIICKTLSQSGWQRSDLTIDTIRSKEGMSKRDADDATPTTAQSDVNPGALAVAHAISAMNALQPQRPRLQRGCGGDVRFDVPESPTKPGDTKPSCTSRPSALSLAAVSRQRKATPFPKQKASYFSEFEDDAEVGDQDEDYECSSATITPSSSH